MKQNVKFKGQIKANMRWPLFLILFWVPMVGILCVIDIKAGVTGTCFLLLYVLLTWVRYKRSQGVLMQEMIEFASNYAQVQKQLLKDFEVPYILLDADGIVLWENEKAQELFNKESMIRKRIGSIFPEITKKELSFAKDASKDASSNKQVSETAIHYQNRDYRASFAKVNLEDFSKQNGLMELPEERNYLISLYLFDCTELNRLKIEKEQEKVAVGLIYIDNYDEALESVENVRQSLLIALVDRRINKYFSEHDAIVRKTEKDKYVMFLRKRSLDALQSQKFNVLEEVKSVNIGNEMAVTLSIGIGLNGLSYGQNIEYARQAIELALGRGGDQVVVKNGDSTSYFGGKSESVERNTRVKARVKAHAMKEIISGKDRVVVMGHKIPDVDVLGAAVGIYRAAKSLNKPVHIVIDSPPKSIQPLMNRFIGNADYDSRMFINCKEARDLVDRNTVLVVVDTNKPNYTECEELLNQTRAIIVLDHHRQGREVIRNAVLSYIEPYASSASEMVSEILQYFSDDIRIRGVEADCMYAGIMIDTNNFITRTGVRTFEAAAFLRRCGADVTRVRKMFRDDINDYRAKAAAVANLEMHEGHFAISVCPSENLSTPTVVGAQAANDLLNVVGVKASFVLTEYNDTIYVSARAIDEVNVQVIMERLGGGGHMNMAGAQFRGATVNEIILLVKRTLTQMIDEGDLS